MNERPFRRTFGTATVALALLFTVLGADPASGLPPLAALCYWLAHVGVGLLLASGVAASLNRWPRALGWPVGVRLLVAGVGGALLFTPLGMGIESWFPEPAPTDEGDLLDRWEAAGGVAALAAEFLHVAPSYVLAWLLVNFAARFGALGVPRVDASVVAGAGTTAATAPSASAQGETPSAAVIVAAPEPVAELMSVAAATPVAASTPVTASTPVAADRGVLAALPPLIVRDVVHVEADLHYLQVHTTRGRAMLLGSLASVESELGGTGTRVHRSHWVAHGHVRRISRTAAGWYCELDSGSRVPISRRRVQLVRSRLGTGFVVESEPQ